MNKEELNRSLKSLMIKFEKEIESEISIIIAKTKDLNTGEVNLIDIDTERMLDAMPLLYANIFEELGNNHKRKIIKKQIRKAIGYFFHK